MSNMSSGREGGRIFSEQARSLRPRVFVGVLGFFHACPRQEENDVLQGSWAAPPRQG
jgi:hypothetical protein